MGVGCILRDGVAKKVDGFGFATISVLDTYRTGSKFSNFQRDDQDYVRRCPTRFLLQPFLTFLFSSVTPSRKINP